MPYRFFSMEKMSFHFLHTCFDLCIKKVIKLESYLITRLAVLDTSSKKKSPNFFLVLHTKISLAVHHVRFATLARSVTRNYLRRKSANHSPNTYFAEEDIESEKLLQRQRRYRGNHLIRL
jgi:hypothetical protein